MSEETKITAVEKTKDPKKVEAGKKLVAMSKQAKEKKSCRTRTPTENSPDHTPIKRRRRMGRSSCWSCCRWSCWIGHVFRIHQIHNKTAGKHN